jgi:hypothetical protein
VANPRFYTTLENSPIDFIVLGTDARQGYEADTCVLVAALRAVRCCSLLLMFLSLLRTC